MSKTFLFDGISYRLRVESLGDTEVPSVRCISSTGSDSHGAVRRILFLSRPPPPPINHWGAPAPSQAHCQLAMQFSGLRLQHLPNFRVPWVCSPVLQKPKQSKTKIKRIDPVGFLLGLWWPVWAYVLKACSLRSRCFIPRSLAAYLLGRLHRVFC